VLSDFARGVESARQSNLPAITCAERGERVPLSPVSQSPAATDAENIFLTGAFGFLGCFLPAEFLKRTQATVYFPVRSSTSEEELGRKPYPYGEEDVAYENKTQGHKLAATLTIPQDKGPFPAVVLITGSGPQDRDETIMGYKPFLVLADYLTRRGIAVLRADNRGVGKSTGQFSGATTADFATDTEAGIAYLKARPEVNPKMIGLIGHSEGGIIAPMVAARNPDVAFITMLAGTGVPGDEIIDMRVELLAGITGKSREEALKDSEKQRKILEIVKQNADDGLMEKQLREELADEMSSAQIGDLIRQLNHRWLRFFITYDPTQALRKVTCPVLALHGDKDLLVAAKQNLPPIRKALEAAGNRNFEIDELPGLNHLFQTVNRAPSEQAATEETISPVVLEKIAKWILKVAG
jgi:pimeloyl-ACP methyl ester carboxylesterase